MSNNSPEAATSRNLGPKEILERFYEIAKQYEFYPADVLRNRYKDYQIPIEFQNAFDFILEHDVMKMLGHYLQEYQHNTELLRAKYILYIIELIESVKSRLDQGIPFGNYPTQFPYDTIEKASELISIKQFLTGFRESVITAMNIATQPVSIPHSKRATDSEIRGKQYLDLLERVGVKSRAILR